MYKFVLGYLTGTIVAIIIIWITKYLDFIKQKSGFDLK